MDLSLYKKMIGATSVPDAYKQGTIEHVNSLFEDQPSFKQIVIEGNVIDCLLNHTDKSTEVELLFRPMTKVLKGSYVNIEDSIYMVTEYTPNEIYPKAKLELCNSAIKWYDQKGIYRNYNCIVNESSFKNALSKEQVVSSISDLMVMVKYDSITESITFAQRFVFGVRTYEVTAIDTISHVYNNEGFVSMRVALVSTSSTDDVGDGVADNSGNSGWGDW